MALDRKTLARLRVLTAVAWADGEISNQETDALNKVLDGQDYDMDALLAEQIDIDAELALLDDDERKQLYEVAFVIAQADGWAATAEVALLKKIYEDAGEDTLFQQVMGEMTDTIMPSTILPVADPVARQREIMEDTLKYSALAGTVGAMPIPGVGVVTDLLVVGIQLKLVRDIGQYYGHKVDKQSARSLMGSFAGSIGTRVVVNNLMRFVPGWGSVFGAVTSFATTFAIGKVVDQYFSMGHDAPDEDALKDLFARAKEEGKAAFDEHKARVDAAKENHGERIAELNNMLASGEISQDAYTEALAGLV